MIEDAKRSIAFLCPSCRQPVILERSVFQLAAAGGKLPCPCGKSSIRIDLMGDRVNLTVPCLFCEQEHTVTCSTHAFLTEKFALPKGKNLAPGGEMEYTGPKR